MNRLISQVWPLRAWMVSLLSLVAVTATMFFVDLKPQVDNDFFFASDSKQFESERQIAQMFPIQEQMIISAKGDIYSPEYYGRIEELTKNLLLLETVAGVTSLSNGPGNAFVAEKSPLWRRLLISDDKEASNLIIFIDSNSVGNTVVAIEGIVSIFSRNDFQLKIAGAPYVVELIRRQLIRDLIVFSAATIFIFAIVVFIIFSSFRILLGTLVSCIDASVLTLVLSQILGVKIGILTANLSTIVFVLTLSHIVFITSNWRRICESSDCLKNKDACKQAVEYTFKASFWCMLTTFLGFIALIFVQAKPLRELGVSGAIGTVVAIIISYSVYPLFLRSVKEIKEGPVKFNKENKVFVGHYMWATVMIAFIIGVCCAGVPKLNTDPSLLSYFSRDRK
ncbi:MAG: MMPL family transporter, partial [Candidatus Omnitrophica bacterium]|nr:MMPL family transporter [Candidatus Omnitrophota bacterium]